MDATWLQMPNCTQVCPYNPEFTQTGCRFWTTIQVFWGLGLLVMFGLCSLRTFKKGRPREPSTKPQFPSVILGFHGD